MFTNQRRGRTLSAVAITGIAALTLAACSGGGDEDAGGDAEETNAAEADSPVGESTGEFTYLGQTQNTTINDTLTSLSTEQCSAENEAAPLVTDAIDGTTWDQQLQLLAGQDALSNMSMAGGTPALMKEFIDAGYVVNLSDELERLGVEGQILPAAESTITSLYGEDSLYALPTEFNIEGFWFNEQMFEENGVEVPTTWDELVAAAETLDAAGVQPFVAAGQDGWPITRLVGDYIFRDLGGDALQAVADGEASLTDPEYVAAADAVSALGEAGYFGDAAGSIDYNTAMNEFLTGGGAMFYMGSWALGNFNDPEQNQIGVDNIGYFPFPDVSGGAGSRDEVPANVGIPVMFTTSNYGEDTADWLACVVENYGQTALEESGQVTGFEVEPTEDQSELTTQVQGIIADAPSSVLWFEALFSAEGTTVSQTNGGGLATGSLSGQEFMELVQAGNQG